MATPQEAWNKFTKSGKVTDYLAFKEVSNSVNSQNKKENSDAAEHGRNSNSRTEYR